MVFQINYKKTKLLDIETLANKYEANSEGDIKYSYNPFHITNLQNYNPHYGIFFQLNETNYNSISFNHEYYLQGDKIVNSNGKHASDKEMFIKFSPLLDPIRYLSGKYDIYDPSIRIMPNLKNTDSCHPKISSIYNVSYNDSFFSFLTSKLVHEHGFIHGVDYYGSYLGVQELFKTIITDDLDYLNNSEYFLGHLNKEFFVTTDICNDFANVGSRANKHRIRIGSDKNMEEDIEIIEDLCHENVIEINTKHSTSGETPEIEEYEKKEYSDNDSDSESSHNNYSDSENVEEDVFETIDLSSSVPSSNEIAELEPVSVEYLETNNLCEEIDIRGEEICKDTEPNKKDDSSPCEIDLSLDEQELSDKSDQSDVSSRSSYTDEDEEDEIYAYIKNFPIQMICQEKCQGTLDQLFEDEEIDFCVDEETGPALMMQVIMILITLQKAFDFTHNDLHTNNIMYVDTDKEYLYYKYNNQYYKVPTYGKIMKIIDFGRAIYKFKGNQYCSDSFAVGGDAYTQYNFEPFYNPKKPTIMPNPSFDLCRLGCSIYDFIIDDEDKEEEMDEFQQTIRRWCCDDNGKNVLYKSNGEERYPDFKLYKMIARNVHKLVPKDELEQPVFKKYKMAKNKVKTKAKIIDIDEIPVYV
jgi:hypothetical protein